MPNKYGGQTIHPGTFILTSDLTFKSYQIITANSRTPRSVGYVLTHESIIIDNNWFLEIPVIYSVNQ